MIRWRQPADDDGIVELVRTELVPLSPRSNMRSSRLRQDIASRLRTGATLVASGEGGSAPYAFVHMQIRQPVLFIDLLAVGSAHQHRRWGTGLMKMAEKYGYGEGCTEARLFVDDANARGLRFYAKLGYSAVRHLPGPRCWELAKPLAVPWPQR